LQISAPPPCFVSLLKLYLASASQSLNSLRPICFSLRQQGILILNSKPIALAVMRFTEAITAP
jgi:hypothetical protein